MKAWWAGSALASALVASALGCAEVHRQPLPLAELVSPVLDGAPRPHERRVCRLIGISDDGQVVAFTSNEVHLEADVPGPECRAYVFDRDSREIVRIAPDVDVRTPYLWVLSPDGETVTYVTSFSGLVETNTVHATRWRDGTEVATTIPVRGSYERLSADGTMALILEHATPPDITPRWIAYDLVSGAALALPVELREGVGPLAISVNGDWCLWSSHFDSVDSIHAVHLRSGREVVYPVFSSPERPTEMPVFVGPSDLLAAIGPDARFVVNLDTGAMTPHPYSDLSRVVDAASDGATVLLARAWEFPWPANRLPVDVWQGHAAEAAWFESSTAPIRAASPVLVSADGRWALFQGRHETSRLVPSAYAAYVLPLEP